MENGKLTREEKMWLTWFVLTAGSFAVLEAHAIYNKKSHGTLTYSIRKACGLHPAKPWRTLGSVAVVGASTWFAAHIVTGKFVPPGMQITKEIVVEVEDV